MAIVLNEHTHNIVVHEDSDRVYRLLLCYVWRLEALDDENHVLAGTSGEAIGNRFTDLVTSEIKDN